VANTSGLCIDEFTFQQLSHLTSMHPRYWDIIIGHFIA